MSADGLRAIWIATYAASWIAETERRRASSMALVEPDADIAVRAVNAATDAARALRDAYLERKIRGTERIAMMRDALGEDLVDQLDARRGGRTPATSPPPRACPCHRTRSVEPQFDVGLARDLAGYISRHTGLASECAPDRTIWAAVAASLRDACTEITRLRAELAATEVR